VGAVAAQATRFVDRPSIAPDALAKTHGKRDQTTTLLGVSRATPWRKMKEIGLDD